MVSPEGPGELVRKPQSIKHTHDLLPRSPAFRSPDAASASPGTFWSVSGVRVSPQRVVRAARPVVSPCVRRAGRPARLQPVSPGWSGGPGTASTAAPPDARTGPQPAPRADGVVRHLPYFCRGQVVLGFGRGSKQPGIPTAKFPEQVVDNIPADVSTGIYYGWASGGSGDVRKTVVSIGWNPYCKHTKKSMETHIMHTFKEDFYAEILNVAIVGYLRPEKNFDSLESLISAIQGDIEEAKKRLELPEHSKLKEYNFFPVPKSKIMNGH
ncbi:riboflavin kinase-like [Physeter macrocephalus]|uniref:Riboflavin kinase n=1 Tax=Physeter macrocephalus TaxID=9755 RepID=A0A9W2WKN6_PHYMC|nr:riboflavin kinase-like [Physeter catodon]